MPDPTLHPTQLRITVLAGTIGIARATDLATGDDGLVSLTLSASDTTRVAITGSVTALHELIIEGDRQLTDLRREMDR